MKRFLKILITAAALSASVAHASGRSQDGWPLPWPFPWAKECPMDWHDLDGTYLLSDSTDAEQLIMRINVVSKKGLRVVHVSRYSEKGRLLFEGVGTVTERQRVIGLWLSSRSDSSVRVWATIKMHYQSSITSCSVGQLIPILTVQELAQDAPPDGVDYKMVKVDKR
jgi:hypothetical protein